MHGKLNLFLPIAFIEGAVVMAVELTGAKLISPWFGTSLYVWAAVLGVTMMGLAGGYFFGGILSERMKDAQLLFFFLGLASFFTALMPISGPWIMDLTAHWDPRSGALLSACVFILPPMLLLGSISPMLVRQCALIPEKTGKISGTLYAISTLGGVAATFLLGFYLIPLLGLKKPILLFAGLALIPVLIWIALLKFRLPYRLTVIVGATLAVILLASAMPIPDQIPETNLPESPTSPLPIEMLEHPLDH